MGDAFVGLSGVTTVLVTGGNGFLGRFLVNLILEKLPDTALLKVFDQNPVDETFRDNCIMRAGKTKVEFLVGDIRDSPVIKRAVQAVDCVFHTAGVIDVSMFPDDASMWDVNVKGTQNLVEACFAANVSYLVNTSSVNAVIDMNNLTNAQESDLTKPKTWFWGGYGETKWYAEQIVLEADNIPLPNDQRLRTICLRPTVLYGENDRSNVGKLLTMTRDAGGVATRIGGKDTALQQSYVGNVAWSMILALEALVKNPTKCAGQAYFITDDSPVMDVFSFAEPFLVDQGMKCSSFRIPLAVIYYGFALFMFVLNFVRFFVPDLTVPSAARALSLTLVRSLGMRFTFSRKKAEDLLGYRPLYSFEESLERSREYYLTVK